MKKTAFFLPILVMASSVWGTIGDVWDAKSQWSDYTNPSTITSPPYGSWSYRHGIGQGLLVAVSGTPGGWSVDGTGNVPNLYDTPYALEQPNEFYGHGPWIVRWKSPIRGYVKVTGSMLQMYEITRRMKYQIRHNGTTFIQGLVPEDASGNTITAFASGPASRAGLVNFGPAVLWVDINDTIDYAAIAGSPAEGGSNVATFVFASLRIEEVVAPDPWDAKAQWSNSANPNVISTSPDCAWSYRDATSGGTFGNLLLATASGVGGSPGGWSRDGTANTIPNLFTDAWGALQQSDEFGGHGPWLIRWTSPTGGYIKVTATLLQLFEPTRRMKLQLLQNGTLVSQVLAREDQAGNTIIAYPDGQPPTRQGLVTIGPVFIPVSLGDNLDLAAVAADASEGGNGTPTFVYATYKIESSTTPLTLPNIVGDVNRDDCVNLEDFLALANNWLASDCGPPRWCEATDINQDHNVDMADYYYLAGNYDQCFTLLRNMGYIAISPYGPADGGDYGPYTPGTQTSGFQEAFNYAVAHNKDVFIVGGGHKELTPSGWIGPVVYGCSTTINVPPAGYWRVTGGDYVLGFNNTTSDCIVFDSLQNCQIKLGLVVAGAINNGYAIIKLKPRNPHSDGVVAISNSSFLINAFVGKGDVFGNGTIPQGTAWQFDASLGPIEHSEFRTMEINACNTGFLLDQGDIRDNYFECPFDHITSNLVVVNSGTQNRFDAMLNPGGAAEPVVGANINGGSQNIFNLSWAGWGSGSGAPIIFGANARDNIVYARYGLLYNLVVNNATVPTNLIIPNEPIGYSVATPTFPASNTDVKNTSSLSIMITISSVGTSQVSSWSITDADGGAQTISGSSLLRAGQNIYLAPGDTIRFTYTSSAPTWVWRAAHNSY